MEPGSPYGLSNRNMFIVIGCNVQVTLKSTVDNTPISSFSLTYEGDQSPYDFIHLLPRFHL